MRVPAALSIVALTALPISHVHAENGRSIALVLDASGSMKARLPDGTTRIEAAKTAVGNLVGKLPVDARLALRVYGHQSPPQRRNCEDTALLVPFDTAANNKAAVLQASRSVEAQGYTPIAYVLKLAAGELAGEEATSRVVVLVSDGQETCGGDPCVAAKALADADAKLVVHAIGLAVDAAARFQLQCLASAARGTYFDAQTGGDLARMLGEAAEKAPAPKKTEIVVASPKPGRLHVKGATRDGHQVINATTGQRITLTRPGTGQAVDEITPMWQVVELPAGIYNVTFANGLWRGIEVKAGETAVLEPGILEIRNADLQGHRVLDPETGEAVAELLMSKNRVALIPSRFSVTFGQVVWPDVEVKPGQTTTLNPGVIHVTTRAIAKYDVVGPNGQVVGQVGKGAARRALPAGHYNLKLPDRNVPINLKEGEVVTIKIE